MEKTKIFLIEDHDIVRKGILSVLEMEQNIEIIGHSPNVSEGIEKIYSGLHVDLILSDMDMPGKNGIELVKTLKQSHPHIRIVILTMLDDKKLVYETISAGADGYLLKSGTIDELLFAIKHVALGGKHICSELAYDLLKKQSCEIIPARQRPELSLSDREQEVLVFIAQGLTNNEIAEKMFASRRTIEGHRQKLLEKTGTSNTATLIKFAVEHQLIS